MDYEEEVEKIAKEMGFSKEALMSMEGDKADTLWNELVKQFRVNVSRGHLEGKKVDEKIRKGHEELAYNVAVFYTKLYLSEAVRG